MTKAWAGLVMRGLSRFGAEERPPKPYNQKALISYFPSGNVLSNVDYYSAEHCLGNTDLRDFYFSCYSTLLETFFFVEHKDRKAEEFLGGEILWIMQVYAFMFLLLRLLFPF